MGKTLQANSKLMEGQSELLCSGLDCVDALLFPHGLCYMENMHHPLV